MSYIFAYNGFDILKNFISKQNTMKDILKSNFEENQKAHKTFLGTDIENENNIAEYIVLNENLKDSINQYSYFDNRKAKLLDSIDIEYLLNNKVNRWLKFLQPSISITINPLEKNKIMREQFSHSLSVIKQELFHHSLSPFMIFNANDKLNKTNYDSQKIQYVKLRRNLFLFDMIEIFKFDLEKVIEIARKIFYEKDEKTYNDIYKEIELDNNKKSVDDNTYTVNKLSRNLKGAINTSKKFIYKECLTLIYDMNTVEFYFGTLKKIDEKLSSYSKKNKHLIIFDDIKDYLNKISNIKENIIYISPARLLGVYISFKSKYNSMYNEYFNILLTMIFKASKVYVKENEEFTLEKNRLFIGIKLKEFRWSTQKKELNLIDYQYHLNEFCHLSKSDFFTQIINTTNFDRLIELILNNQVLFDKMYINIDLVKIRKILTRDNHFNKVISNLFQKALKEYEDEREKNKSFWKEFNIQYINNKDGNNNIKNVLDFSYKEYDNMIKKCFNDKNQERLNRKKEIAFLI